MLTSLPANPATGYSLPTMGRMPTPYGATVYGSTKLAGRVVKSLFPMFCHATPTPVAWLKRFVTPARGGTFRWQCIIPCGLGYVDGNGGPMATPGYMAGQMEVQA